MFESGARPHEIAPAAKAGNTAGGPAARSESPGSCCDRVLCVDLDGTLVATDLLWEGMIALVRERPQKAALLPFWLTGGKAHFKARVAEQACLDVSTLPYRAEVLEYLQAEHAAGRPLVLATAADRSVADRVSEHLGIFSDVLASDGRTNLAGPAKSKAIEERFGRGRYSYIGDATVDIPLWQACDGAIVVAPSQRLLTRIGSAVPVERVFPSASGSRWRAVLSALRVHQWVKNILIFVPVLLDHQFGNVSVLLTALLAFFAFSFAASGGYVLNDVLDVEADRGHPTKRFRPFASGALPLSWGAGLVPLLFVAAVAISVAALPWMFLLLLVGYVVLTCAYSLYLKRVAVLDVILLAGLYTLRVLAGVAATGVRSSTWLLAFSMFLFLSLAFMKRYAEIFKGGKAPGEQVARRGYTGADLDWLRSMGGSSGYLSVLVLALYISSDEVTTLYTRPEALWMICPLLLLWISRMWFRTHRGKLDEDPIVATAKDPVNYGIGALVALMLFVAL